MPYATQIWLPLMTPPTRLISPKVTEMRQQPPPKVRIQLSLVPLFKLLKTPKANEMRRAPPPKLRIQPPLVPQP